MTAHVLIDALEAAPAWSQLTMSEQIALRAIVRRAAAMAADGATPEDWQQLAGYAEWAITPKTQNTLGKLAGATVAGQWIERNEKHVERPCSGQVIVQARYRNGSIGPEARAGLMDWSFNNEPSDIVAYRLVD